MPRQAAQPSFSDLVINDDEELEQELRKILENQPTEEELEKAKARRAANKRVKSILLERHRTDCDEASETKEWFRIGEIAVIQPAIIRRSEETKKVTYYPGGKTDITVKIQPAEWQKSFFREDPIEVTV